MIYERRAYLLRQGEEDAFWEAQEKWNSGPLFQPLLQSNLFYLVCPGEDGTEILHFYRYDDLNHWRATYDRYFAAQDSAFFATVRGLMLSQQTDFFVESPFYPGNGVRTSEAIGDDLTVVETIVDALPGQLPRYWEGADDQPLIAVQSLTGTLHRALEYRAFPTEENARAFAETMTETPCPAGLRHRQVRIGRAPALPGRFSYFEGGANSASDTATSERMDP
ncbi:hypothetical protein [uncultured Roseibium sp.]|uniref:hypothetical protein n=1 Tax=uncultured Roseibium sp. TaxID=1936171 RepID=UPI0032179CBF